MGIDYSGGMIVGEYGSEISIEDLGELVDQHDLDVFHPYYDADLSASIIGIQIHGSWEVSNLDGLVNIVKELSEDLKELGFERPKLYGAQNIW